MRPKHLVLFAIALLLPACALQPLPTEKAQQYKRVGVLSAMGDRFAKTTTGITVFSNSYAEAAMDFGADEVLTEKFTRALSSRYDVVDLSRHRKAWLAEPMLWPGDHGPFTPDYPDAQDVARKLFAAEGLDAYVLIVPGTAKLGSSYQAIAGLGFVKHSALIGDDALFLHNAYIVSIFDGRDFGLVANMRAGSVDTRDLTNTWSVTTANAPAIRVPVDWWDDPAPHKDEIQAMFVKLMDRSVPDTITRANLGQPAAAASVGAPR